MPNLLPILRDCLDANTLPGIATYALLFIAFAWLAGRFVRLAVQRVLHGTIPLADPTAVKFLGQFARLIIYIVAILSYFHLVPALRQLGSVWLASVGLVSVVVGLAAQSTLGNLISGISLLLYRPFRLGHRLQVSTPAGLETGTVESLSLGYTTLLTDDHRKILIPNSVMAGQTSINLSAQHAAITINLTLGFQADIPRARTLLTDLVKSHNPSIELTSCRTTALTDTAITLTLTITCPNPASAPQIKSDLLDAIKSRLATESIPLAH